MKSGRQEFVYILALLVKNRKLRKISQRALCLGVFALLWLLNWQLFLATSVGISLMAGCYLVQNPHWQKYWQQWQRYLAGSNRQLLLSVGGGATAAFCTYLAASIWSEADNQWLATGAILQGFTSLATLGILSWSLWVKKADNLEVKLEKLLADLSHSSHLKRLVAIRQLTSLLKQNCLSSEHHWQAIEYYRLMLSEPQVPMVKNALLESLNALGGKKLVRDRPRINIAPRLQQVKLNQPEKHLI